MENLAKKGPGGGIFRRALVIFASVCLALLPTLTGANPDLSRIVSLTPAAHQNLLRLGFRENIVGTCAHCASEPNRLPVLITFQTVSWEQMLLTKPTLGVTNGEALPEPILERLRAHSIQVLKLNTNSIEGLIKSIDMMGKQSPSLKLAQEKLKSRTYCRRFKDFSKVAIVIQWAPLMVATDKSFLGDALKQCGVSIFAEGKNADYTRANTEALILAKNLQILDVSRGLNPPRVLKNRVFLKSNDPNATLPGLPTWDWLHTL